MDLEQLMHLTLNMSKQNSISTCAHKAIPHPTKLFFPSHLMVPTFTKFLRTKILMSLFISFPFCHIQLISISCWLFRYIPNLSNSHHFYPYYHGSIWVLSCLHYCCSLLIGFPDFLWLSIHLSFIVRIKSKFSESSRNFMVGKIGQVMDFDLYPKSSGMPLEGWWGLRHDQICIYKKC